ncbi:hypothetical protein QBC36DRAFT_295607 [Triangularia setosa]|uniref:Uncharacterized protein n=1 Tax=Triangularia setosa TaxID=2587417 RepID=A0AAN7A2P9_9PEZI|nr:hypothetical protein QBC36DRAFT_295607 [Podospora setosa]
MPTTQSQFNSVCDAMIEYHIGQKSEKRQKIKAIHQQLESLDAETDSELSRPPETRNSCAAIQDMIRSSERMLIRQYLYQKLWATESNIKYHEQETKKWKTLRG